MHACQPGLDDAPQRADYLPQMRHQAGNAHPDAPLAQHLPRQVQRRLAPGMAERTPAREHLMLDHPHWRGRRQVYHLPTTRQMDPAQMALARWTVLKAMFDHFGGRLQAARVVLLWRTLLPRRPGLLRHVRFHESGRRCFLGFQLGQARLSRLQSRRKLIHLLPQGAQFVLESRVFCPQGRVFGRTASSSSRVMSPVYQQGQL